MNLATRTLTSAFLFGFALSFTACQSSKSPGSTTTVPNSSGSGGLGGFESSFGTAGSTGSAGTLNLADSTGALTDAVDQAAAVTEDPAQQQALGETSSFLQELLGDYGGLRPGQTPQSVLDFIRQMEGNREQAARLSQMLYQANLDLLARIFALQSHKIDVLRFFNPTINRHFYTLSELEGYIVSALHGYRLEGVGFRVYDQPIGDCNVTLYRCFWPQGNSHFISTAANCEGQVQETPSAPHFGYICPSQRTEAYLPLAREVLGDGDHLSTISPEEIAHTTTKLGWKLEGYQGYPPN